MKRISSVFSLLAIVTALLGLQQLFDATACYAKSKEHSSHKTSTYKPKNIPGNWQSLTNTPPFGEPDSFPAAGAQLLLTDGSVLVQNFNFPHTGEVWKLTPDSYGSYINGTWTQVASLPPGYSPANFASAVLPDGRVIFEGGHYNGPFYDEEDTSLGAIYDPVTDSWTPVNPPEFFANGLTGTPFLPIGAAQSVVLEDGTFMLADSLSLQSALLDAKTLTWTPTGRNKFDVNLQEGWTLLPSGKVFTVDTLIAGPFIDAGPRVQVLQGNTELYTPKTGSWSPTDDTNSVPLSDIGNTDAIGPQVLRPDGTVFVVGATYSGNTAIYDSNTSTWLPGPVLPSTGDTQPIGSQAVVIIDPPNAAEGTYAGKLGAQAVSQVFFDISGPIVPTVPANADTTVTNDLTNCIALIATDGFGTGTLNKGANAVAAGAIGCIFYDNTGNDFAGNINGSSEVPSIMVPYATGQTFLANLDGLTGTMTIEVSPVEVSFAAQGAPAALLPNGNVLFAACKYGIAVLNESNGVPPSKFFEFNGSEIVERPAVPVAEFVPAAAFNMLILPTGQIMMTDTVSLDVEIYTPGDLSYEQDWAPVIQEAPKNVHPGKTYKIEGIGFNGMSQGAMFGNAYQSATNYPLVRITNSKTGRVFYARTHDHSYMGVASDKKVHTYFDVPANIDLGKSVLEVVANGIPSKPYHIHVK